MTIVPYDPVCRCGWQPLNPRGAFASHLVWHLDWWRRMKDLSDFLDTTRPVRNGPDGAVTRAD